MAAPTLILCTPGEILAIWPGILPGLEIPLKFPPPGPPQPPKKYKGKKRMGRVVRPDLVAPRHNLDCKGRLKQEWGYGIGF